MAERARIATFFAPLAMGEAGSFALTDDAAVLTLPAGQSLIVTTDSVIGGIHLPADAAPQYYAQKLMRRNLSDLAAMGAKPWRYTLNLHTPRAVSDDWFASFAATLEQEQSQFGMVLAGGDTTSGEGPIHLSMTCLGLVDGTPLRRAGAMAGDDLYVSGTLGDAAFALQQLQHHVTLEPLFLERYYAPTPRLELGQMLRRVATAGTDISDGLLADLSQLCHASKVGAVVQRETLPLHPALADVISQDPHGWRLPLSGGDDYELLFTAAPQQRMRIESIARALKLPLTCIGYITSAPEITLRDGGGDTIHLKESGWEYH